MTRQAVISGRDRLDISSPAAETWMRLVQVCRFRMISFDFAVAARRAAGRALIRDLRDEVLHRCSFMAAFRSPAAIAMGGLRRRCRQERRMPHLIPLGQFR